MLVVFATMCALLVVPPLPCPVLYLCWLLGGSWDLVSKVISTLIGVISIVTLIITLVTKSHDPLSRSLAQLRAEMDPGIPVTFGRMRQVCRTWSG